MTLLFAVLVAALSMAAMDATRRALQGWRARRRAAWELERADWRLWISRLQEAAGR